MTSTQSKILLPAVIDEMEEPLLEVASQEKASRSNNHNGNDCEKENSEVRMHGAVVGFLTQLINISGTAIITYRWGPNADLFSEHNSICDHLLHLFVSLVSQIDLCLYVVMWVGLTAALTDRGIELWQKMLGRPRSARSIFVMGVQFYAGVVIGSFFSWF